jgi:site-specific recombinase XerC
VSEFSSVEYTTDTKSSRLTWILQKTLGHADLSTTMIYTHLVDDDVAHAMRTFRQSESAAALKAEPA